MQTCKLTKKALSSHILLHILCLHFLRIHHDYFFQRVFESVWAHILSGNISGLLVIYLFNCNSSKSTPCWRCNWTFSWVQFLSNKLKFICFLRCKITRTSFFLLMLCFYICDFVMLCVLFYKNLVVLRLGDNNFLFYFDICIKFTLSSIISTMKKWQHVYLFMLKICLREKKNVPS